MRSLVDSMGGSMAHFLEQIKVNERQGGEMDVCFTQLIWSGSGRLHSVPLTTQHRLPHPMGINLGTYKIWDGRGFAPLPR